MRCHDVPVCSCLQSADLMAVKLCSETCQEHRVGCKQKERGKGREMEKGVGWGVWGGVALTWQPTGKLPDSASWTSLSFISDTPAGRSVVNLHDTASQVCMTCE